MKNIVYIATSMDGFIADSHNNLDWLTNLPNPDGSDFGFSKFIDTIDALVMGRKTFEKVLSFSEWPYKKKVFVLSRTLKKVPPELEDKVEIVSGDINDIISSINKRGFFNLYIDGGETIQSFLKMDLIDEMIITRVSIILGGGIPLFGNLDNQITFKVLETIKLSDNMVQTRYVRGN